MTPLRGTDPARSATECDHDLVIGTWRYGEEVARRCDDCGAPLDENGDPIDRMFVDRP